MYPSREDVVSSPRWPGAGDGRDTMGIVGNPGFFKMIVLVVLIAGAAYGAKLFWDANQDTIKGNTPTPVVHQPPAVPNPYGK